MSFDAIDDRLRPLTLVETASAFTTLLDPKHTHFYEAYLALAGKFLRMSVYADISDDERQWATDMWVFMVDHWERLDRRSTGLRAYFEQIAFRDDRSEVRDALWRDGVRDALGNELGVTRDREELIAFLPAHAHGSAIQ